MSHHAESCLSTLVGSHCINLYGSMKIFTALTAICCFISYVKCTFCKSLWIKASNKCKCKLHYWLSLSPMLYDHLIACHLHTTIDSSTHQGMYGVDKKHYCIQRERERENTVTNCNSNQPSKVIRTSYTLSILIESNPLVRRFSQILTHNPKREIEGMYISMSIQFKENVVLM